MTLRRHTGAWFVLALSCALLLALPVSAHALDTVYWETRYTGPDDMTDALDNVPVAGAANAVAFSDAAHGWMVGVRGDGVSLSGSAVKSAWYAFTLDGGSTWTSESIPATGALGVELFGVAAPTNTDVIAVGENGTIARLNSGSWTATQVAGWTGKALRGVAFADASRGWAVGDGRGILSTIDGGVTWTSDVVPGAAGAYYGIAAVDATHVWVVGDYGSMMFWNGSGWEQKSSGTTRTLRAIAFKDATHGRAVGEGATFVATTDGATWAPISVPLPPGGGLTAFAISYNSTGTCFVVGASQAVWRTADDGLTWLAGQSDGGTNVFPPYNMSGLSLTGVTFVPGGSGLPVAVGRLGTTLINSPNCKAWAFAATSWPRTLPSAVNLPTTSQVGTTKAVKVDWYDNEPDVRGFTVERSDAAGPYSTIATIGTAAVGLNTWTDTSVFFETIYTYRVRAYSSLGLSGPSPASSPVTLPAPPAVLADAVTSHTVSPGSGGGSAGWYVTTPTVSISRDVTGTTWYRTGAGSWESSSVAALSLAPRQGDVTYQYYGVNSVGVTETPIHSFTIKLDSIPPMTTSDAVANYSYNATITLSAVDAASGVDTTQWQLDAGGWVSSDTATCSTPGAHTVYFKSSDVAGNSEAMKSAVFNIRTDITAPTTTIKADGTALILSPTAWFTASPAITLEPDEPATTFAQLDSGSWSATNSFTISKQGTTTVDYYSIDIGTNRETTKTMVVRVDKTPPVTTSNAGVVYGGPAVITLTPSDPAPGSGLAGTRWSIDGAAATSGTVASTSLVGARTLTWSSVDVAGNRESTETANFTVNPAISPTSITIRTSAWSARTGNVPILSGAITPVGMIGRNMVVYVMKPGKSYWTYSSNRTVYRLRSGAAAWQYKYYFKPGMVKGVYRFKAVVPAYPGFFLASGSPTMVSITLR